MTTKVRGWAGGALALVVLAAGCTSGPAQPEAAPTTTTTQVALPLPPGFNGEFITITGDDANNAGLSRLTFSPPRIEPLTPIRRVSALAACPTAIVVAAAQEAVDFSDHIQLLQDRELVPVPGLGAPFGFVPDLDPQCRLLYSDGGGDDQPEDRLWRFDTGSDTAQVIHTYPGISGMAWGPGGRIAVMESTRSAEGSPSRVTGIRILEPDGANDRVLPPVSSRPGLFEWGATGWMAFGVDRRATALLHPDTQERHDVPGWLPLAWSPDGTQLLLGGTEDRRRLGVLVDVADPTVVTPLGHAPEPIYEATWLPSGSDPLAANLS